MDCIIEIERETYYTYIYVPYKNFGRDIDVVDCCSGLISRNILINIIIILYYTYISTLNACLPYFVSAKIANVCPILTKKKRSYSKKIQLLN